MPASAPLTENIDTTTPAGRMMMQMVGAFVEFERAMIQERTSSGLAAARAEGRIGGRRKKLDDTKRRGWRGCSACRQRLCPVSLPLTRPRMRIRTARATPADAGAGDGHAEAEGAQAPAEPGA